MLQHAELVPLISRRRRPGDCRIHMWQALRAVHGALRDPCERSRHGILWRLMQPGSESGAPCTCRRRKAAGAPAAAQDGCSVSRTSRI